MSDQHIKDAYIKGLNLDNNQKSVKTITTTMNNSKQEKQQNTTLQEQLIQKLINGEISNEAFLQATNLLKSEKKQQAITGYL